MLITRNNPSAVQDYLMGYRNRFLSSFFLIHCACIPGYSVCLRGAAQPHDETTVGAQAEESRAADSNPAG